MSEITVRELQRRVDHWIQTVGVRYFSELTNLAQLMEEVGELARVMSRRFGDQSSKPGESPAELGDELADVLFVLACIANQTGIDLETAFEQSMHKKNARDSQRHRLNAKLRP